MEKFQELKELILSLEGEAEKFYNKGNASAGTRLRQGLQLVKTSAQDLRKAVQEKKNANK